MDDMSLACPSCTKVNPSDMRFCGYCGSALTIGSDGPARSPAPPQEERRLVTVLFCDLVGFTPLSEQLDPEEVREVQSAYFSAMVSQIERYGGIVEKYAGDAVLALFGAPVAHEDDPERAVLCALDMQRAVQPVADEVRRRYEAEVAIRVGVNTGEVVSGSWDASGQQQTAVTGDAVNVAARIQAAAEPGGVLVGAETMRLTRRRVDYGPKQLVRLKGKREPVAIYPTMGIGERWETTRQVVRLVGREREVAGLLVSWERARGGDGQLVTVVGEAGVGKSRLVSEVLEQMSQDQEVRVLRGRCPSYGQSTSLWLIADLLRALFSAAEADSRDVVAERVVRTVSKLLVSRDAEDRAIAADVLGEVLGVPAGGSLVAMAGAQIRRQSLVRSLRLALGALCERQPLVVILEDLHWIDPASAEILEEILADVPGLRLLVLGTLRPDWNAPWNEWDWTERLTVRPLGEADAAILAGAVLGGVSLADELAVYVRERAGGNPFFVEELLQFLQESGGLEQQDGQIGLVPGRTEKLPSTLTEVLLARLDRLESQVKGVAQVGSVIGRNFAVRLLARVMEQKQAALEMPLTALQHAEVAFPQRTPDLEYVFKHVLMREVTYSTLVRRRRQQLHLRTARAIASLYPSDEHVEMVAYHYAKTEEHAEAAEWLERAGDRAAAVYATESAAGHYRETLQRLQALGGDPMAVARVEEKLGTALSTAGWYGEALEVLERAVEAYRGQRELEAAGRVTAQMGIVHRFRGTADEGIVLVRTMLDLLAPSGPSNALASLYIALATLHTVTGRYREMREAAERAGDIARGMGDRRLLGEAEARRALALTELDQPEEAVRSFQRAIPLIEEGGDLLVLFRALNNAGYACQKLGRIKECKRYTGQALAVVERIGNPNYTAFVLASLGSARITLGEWEGAREHLDQALALLGDERTMGKVAPLRYMGQLAIYQGKWEEAARFLGEALEVAQRTGEQLDAVQALLGELDVLTGRCQEAIRRLEALAAAEDASLLVFPPLAWAHLETGAVDRAEEVVADAIRRARAGKQRFHLLDALRVEGMIRVRQDRFEEAERAFQEALELARDLPYPYAQAHTLSNLGDLTAARGEPEGARAHLEEALAIFRRLEARKDVERTEQALAEPAGA